MEMEELLAFFLIKIIFGGKDKDDRIDNSADMILTYTEDGTEVNLVCLWSTSHSLA